jgi:hypothetical protein
MLPHWKLWGLKKGRRASRLRRDDEGRTGGLESEGVAV